MNLREVNELREQLARRLASLKWPGLLHTGERVSDMDIDEAQGQIATWGIVADEVIRQMEWARTRQVAAIDSNGSVFITDGDWGTSWRNKSLTLAPDDWKP